MKTGSQDMAIAAFGAVTSVLTACILVAIEQYFDFSFYGFMLWLIIPVGAVFSGCAAATGYYVGARLFGYRPTALLLLHMIAISVGTFFLVHYLNYLTLQVDGQHISDVLPFGNYLDILLRHQSLQFSSRSAQHVSTGELGSWGYAYALLQIIGFALGGLCIFSFLHSLTYCQKCSRYLANGGSSTRYTTDSEAFSTFIQEFATHFNKNELQEAIVQHAQFGKAKYRRDTYLKSVLQLKRCKECGIHWLDMSPQKRSGRTWIEISEWRMATFHQGELHLDQIPLATR
jgi:hypothetical protein